MEAYKSNSENYVKQLEATIGNYNFLVSGLLTDHKKIEELINTINVISGTSNIGLVSKSFHDSSEMLKTVDQDLKNVMGIMMKASQDGKKIFKRWKQKKPGIEHEVMDYIKKASIGCNIVYFALVVGCGLLKTVKNTLESAIPVATDELKFSITDTAKNNGTILIASMLSAEKQIDDLIHAMASVTLQ